MNAGGGRRPGTDSDGFTLIEVMIAVVVLAIAILGMGSVMAETSRWQSRSESGLELTSAAEAKLEELRDVASAQTADTVQLAVGGSLTASQDAHADSILSAEGRWLRRRWEVIDGPGAARTLTLRVAHREPGERAISSRDFSTIILMAP